MERNQKEILIGLREKIGMNRKEFAEYLEVPYRTMEDWEKGKRQMPDYVLRLIEYRVMLDYHIPVPQLNKDKVNKDSEK